MYYGSHVAFLNVVNSLISVGFHIMQSILAMYEIAHIAFKTQACIPSIFWVFKFLNLVQGRIISLQILSLHFLVFKDF